MQTNDVFGEQKGSRRPLLQSIMIISTLSLLYLLPATAFASSLYTPTQANSYLDKIDSSYGQMIEIAALLHDYDKNLIKAVIVVESEGNAVAVSHKGAKGLMQLMPQTAKSMGAKDPKDPFQNILAGTKYLRQLEDRYGFQSAQDALVAYNMGPTRAKRWLSQYDSSEYGYVKRVMHIYQILEQKDLEGDRLAKIIERKIENDSEITTSARPLMTKPHSIALASLPLTLPSSRRDEVTTDN